MEQITMFELFEIRQETKKENKYLTDAIKEFVSYAEMQGSRNSQNYYTIFAKLANKAIALKSGERKKADSQKLAYLNAIMGIIEEKIIEGITDKLFYKDIYKQCKKRVEEFSEFIPKKLLSA